MWCVETVLSLDAIDMSGKHEVDLDTNIWKVRSSGWCSYSPILWQPFDIGDLHYLVTSHKSF